MVSRVMLSLHSSMRPGNVAKRKLEFFCSMLLPQHFTFDETMSFFDDYNQVLELIEQRAAAAVASDGGGAAAAVAKFSKGRRNGQYYTPLQLACRNNGMEIVQLLVNRGAHVNATHPRGKSALHYAIHYHDNKEMISFLIHQAGADIDLRDSTQGWTPLHIACRYRSVDMVLFLIEKCGANVEATDNDKLTPLHHAAETNNDELALALIRVAGANVEALDYLGRTPLYVSIVYCSTTVFSCLKECGANVDVINEFGETIFHVASRTGVGLLKWLHNQCGSVERVNVADHSGMTPLHHAAAAMYIDMAKLLISAGANVGATDLNGRTPLHIAATGRRLENVLVFLDVMHFADFGAD
jgi:ankyrin repeat protein